MITPLQTADPAVSRAKFDREIEEFRALRKEYGRRGWFLVEAGFPKVLVLMAAPQVKPPPLVLGVLVDYTDYDLRPPSVRLVDPFSRSPFTAAELPTNLRRKVETDAVPLGVALPPGVVPPRVVQEQPLMQAYGPDEVPFLCVAGVREYHDHPAHSGDKWELHRSAGAGRLVRILEVVDTYGIRPLNGYQINLVPQISGLTLGEVPE